MLGLCITGIKTAVFARQLVHKTVRLRQWRLDQVCEVGFSTLKCWECGLPHNFSQNKSEAEK